MRGPRSCNNGVDEQTRMHPSLMKCNQSEAKKPSKTELSGYESAQRKRFLRSEEEAPAADDEQAA